MNLEVEVRSGRLRGVVRGASLAFLGIPYANAPEGPARFAPPVPRAPWSGVRDATRFGAIAPQGAVFAPGVGAEGDVSEDCLTLNVYTPACDGARRPVLFFIHGGAFTVGTANMPLYDGQVLAEEHDVVVISANYRLGALGFLCVPDDASVASNAALLDAAEALRWARDHAALFGGDPANVTIFGESAGASMVTMLMAHAPARGLFHRAIAQSAMDPLRVATPEAASASTRLIFRELGLADGDVRALRGVPLADFSAAQARVEADRDRWPHFLPVRDAASLPEAPADAVLSSDAPRVPLIIGYNRDEWNLFDAANVVEWNKPLADEDAILQVSRGLGSRASAAAELFQVYRESRASRGLRADPRAVVRAILGDLRFRIGSQAMAARYGSREPHTYAYLFSYESPALRGVLGACHALDLPFVFGNLKAPNQDRFAGTGEAVERLSRAMRHAWIAFARGGAPDLPGGVTWPAYDAALRRTMVFDVECRVENDPFGEERRAFPP